MTAQTEKNKQAMQRLIAKKSQNRNNGAFVEELRVELKRIDWPNRKTVIKSTMMILIIVLIATIFVSLLDSAFSEALLLLRRL